MPVYGAVTAVCESAAVGARLVVLCAEVQSVHSARPLKKTEYRKLISCAGSPKWPQCA